MINKIKRARKLHVHLISFLGKSVWGRAGSAERYAHVTVSAKFPPLGINILEKILVELKIANKKESIGMFFIFLAIFSHTHQIFGV